MDVFDVTLAARSFLRDVCVAAAWDLGLFDALPGDVDSIASKLRVPPRRLRVLLDALAFEGVIARRDGAFVAAADRPPRPDVASDGLGALAEVIRRDRPLPIPDETRLRYHDHLATAGVSAARETAQRLLSTTRGSRLLDAGGGNGTYTAAFLESDPTATAILVDTDDVIPLARDRLARFAPRVTFVAGDLTSASPLSLPHDVDIVLLANVIHLFDAATCAAIVSRLAQHIAPGGLLAIKDLHVSADRTGPASAITFALNMAVFTDGGDVHDDDTILGWIRDAGLVDPHIDPLDVSPDTILVTASRPRPESAREREPEREPDPHPRPAIRDPQSA